MKNIILIFFILLNSTSFSQEILGNWKTLDKESGAVNSVVEIYKNNTIYYGKIIAVLRKDYKGACDTCIGKYKNKELTGIVILKDLVQKDKNYEDGEITDPENGKTYSCYVKLENTNKLKIRGYIGFSLLGRTEYWYRLNKQDKDALNQILNNK